MRRAVASSFQEKKQRNQLAATEDELARRKVDVIDFLAV